ncbi:hypothetical protein Pcinc_015621 [Petrolisthes cinctipes]|uniref:Uncharacterized protein n=1 Tax=Petrolisthes cinctipes TaxID=88211 RepID=A0AAE1KQA3_PETCI|nr:hypothetical protein Pcinc_015621 [Petrolisthes cinctipes]
MGPRLGRQDKTMSSAGDMVWWSEAAARDIHEDTGYCKTTTHNTKPWQYKLGYWSGLGGTEERHSDWCRLCRAALGDTTQRSAAGLPPTPAGELTLATNVRRLVSLDFGNVADTCRGNSVNDV